MNLETAVEHDQANGQLLFQGSSYDDFWERTQAGAWQLAGDPAVTDNFAIRIVAVPEPTVIGLFVCGVLVWLWRKIVVNGIFSWQRLV